MTRKFSLGLLGLALVAATGCQTLQSVQPMDIGEVQPGRYESLVLDQLIIVADSSGSMKAPERYPEQKAFLQAFVSAMPRGAYESGAGDYAGPHDDVWEEVPMQYFERPPFANFADMREHLGGTTDMHLWFNSWQDEVEVRTGRAAVLILSDGQAPLVDTMLSIRALSDAYDGELCVFAVQFGDNPEGTWLLTELTRIARCGEVWNHADVNSPEGLEAVVRRIFFQGLPDSDGDGVPDIYDECPDTPRGAKVDERGCWVIDGVLFDYDRSNIKPQYDAVIDEVAFVLQLNPGVRVRLDGHTDSRGSEPYNQGLSERRANSVRQALIDRGIAAQRMETMGYGELRPVRPNDSQANMARNRRVEITTVP